MNDRQGKSVGMGQEMKRIPILVKVVRFTRALRPLWIKISADLERQSAVQARGDAFQLALEAYLRMGGHHGLQIGAGEFPIAGWFNTDLESSSPDVYIMDATQPYPIPDESFDWIFSEHMIEHIPYKGALSMLRECYRILKPGGAIRVATPDLMRFVKLFNGKQDSRESEYMEWSLKEHFGLYAPELTEFQQRKPLWQIDSEHFSTHLPDMKNDGACLVLNLFMTSYGHQFIFDERTLRAALASTGFQNVARVSIGESSFEGLRELEKHSQRTGEAVNQFETMVLEAAKPTN